MTDIIFREHEWFDIETMKPVLSVQATKENYYPHHWMHVIENGVLKTFGNAGARAQWLKAKNKPSVDGVENEK